MSYARCPGRQARSAVAVGIDAGGSSTRARAVANGSVVFDGSAGPGNPLMTDEPTLSASYATALAGCPEPDFVAACVAGAAASEPRGRISGLLARMFPRAVVHVHPDYAAAVLVAPADADVIVLAGTGSVVCSRMPDGAYVTSGGRGWILGDFGSGSRLGRAALERFCDDPVAASPEFAAEVAGLIGTRDWREIVTALSEALSPAPFLARAAPLLSGAAARKEGWATQRLEMEMSALAAQVVRHVEQHLGGREVRRVALSGGVWESQEAELCFRATMERALPRCGVVKCALSPLDGAVRLAESMIR
jgi:N-acetylglucosamine kinase-like BadF-type ATPase